MVRRIKEIVIIGDGAMATLCSLLLYQKGFNITLWSPLPEYAKELAQRRENVRYFPGFNIPPAIRITADTEEISSKGADILINAIPTQYMRSTWQRIAAKIKADVIVSVTKGIETSTLKLPSQILQEFTDQIPIVILSGPNIAIEIARGLPASTVLASKDMRLAKELQPIFATANFRVYTNDDPTGVELAGALKNVIAIAAGIADGLELGTNAKAALLTRGIVEISRLGVRCGAKQQTFSGLAGLGDLITTCFSLHGRNRRFGELIGKGFAPREAEKQIGSVVEGIATSKSAVKLARLHNVEMPITEAVYKIIHRGKSPKNAIKELMRREQKYEFWS